MLPLPKSLGAVCFVEGYSNSCKCALRKQKKRCHSEAMDRFCARAWGIPPRIRTQFADATGKAVVVIARGFLAALRNDNGGGMPFIVWGFLSPSQLPS